ncbi:hypothetical protein WSK_0098 [Novosphingobium sp. Rr 2-17]|uniref:hypothetical protein n=1 Tax=Novosphingobium sp. Rr 2-17 TaxID=555793 RepID=UPI0002697AC9|nr:hypothetical protein [Novosphingobium sp. Rr 2-17]EIZ81153.1 hypothetical protein WSK_0098 [Novosphingobium sp. Rr 2-17]
MKRIGIEVVSGALALALAIIGAIFPISTEEDVNFWIILIGGITIWEGSRFILRNWLRHSSLNGE